MATGDSNLTSRPPKKRFPGLSPLAFEHPLDAAALSALQKIPGIDRFLRLLFRILHEKRARLFFLSSTVRVNENQFPEVYASYQEAREILDIPTAPELFIAQTPFVNAFAYGIDKPIIVLNSASIDLLTPAELQVVIAHELAHVMAGHMLYKSVLFTLLDLIRLGGLGIPFGMIGMGAFVIGLFEWYRKSELTCDRAGLLVAQDLDTCLRVEMKLAGGRHVEKMSIEEFMRQGREYEGEGDLLDSVFKLLNLLYTTHPYAVVRMKELRDWHDTGSYQAILNGKYVNRDSADHVKVSETWAEAARNFTDEMSRSQDSLSRFFGNVGQWFQKGGENLRDWFSSAKEEPPQPPQGGGSGGGQGGDNPPSSSGGWKSWNVD